MLNAFGGGWSRPNEGWSSAYSVTSVLLQLQVFLFDECAACAPVDSAPWLRAEVGGPGHGRRQHKGPEEHALDPRAGGGQRDADPGGGGPEAEGGAADGFSENFAKLRITKHY